MCKGSGLEFSPRARDGGVDVLLDRGLHPHPHLRLDLVGGHEIGGEGVLVGDAEDSHVLLHEGVPDLELPLAERLAPPRVV